MSTKKLDKTQPFATIYGDTEGRVYEQDSLYFRGDGTLWVDPAAPKGKPNVTPAPTPAPTPKPDDQLSQQLGA